MKCTKHKKFSLKESEAFFVLQSLVWPISDGLKSQAWDVFKQTLPENVCVATPTPFCTGP